MLINDQPNRWPISISDLNPNACWNGGEGKRVVELKGVKNEFSAVILKDICCMLLVRYVRPYIHTYYIYICICWYVSVWIQRRLLANLAKTVMNFRWRFTFIWISVQLNYIYVYKIWTCIKTYESYVDLLSKFINICIGSRNSNIWAICKGEICVRYLPLESCLLMYVYHCIQTVGSESQRRKWVRSSYYVFYICIELCSLL